MSCHMVSPSDRRKVVETLFAASDMVVDSDSYALCLHDIFS